MYREVNEMPKCVSCGILIPTAEMHFSHHGRELISCSERCQRIYDTYKYPRYRERIAELELSGDPGLRLGYAPEHKRAFTR
jgi:predicted RNA-binding Zn-ribbon protein involved in translation (DUF1610 family)